MKPALPDHEQIVLNRLESGGNPLGWTPETRVNGVAILKSTSPAPRQPNHTKISRVALTVAGIVSLESFVVDDTTGLRVQPALIGIRRTQPRPRPRPAPAVTGTSVKHIDIHCPSDGALMVRDGGWYRCPTAKCKVVV